MLIKSTTRPVTLTPTPAAPQTESIAVASEPAPQSDTVQLQDTAQAERITRFVEEKKLAAARSLKQVSGLMAGQLAGMTIGSMIFAPLAFKMGNLYIATGGAALTGAAMAWGASTLAGKDISHLTDSKVGNALGVIGNVANSLPKIAYPTLVGATEAQKAVFYGALDQLPLSGVTSSSTIDVVKGLEAVGASGLATPLFSQTRIYLDVDQMGISNSWAKEVVTHETGHAFDFSKGIGPILSRNFRGGGFGKEPFISDYAHTNRMEDYAESYATYHLDPKHLERVAPDKFAAVQGAEQQGLLDKALDRPSVRDAGQKIGSAFEKAPRARNLLAMGAALVAPFQLYRGASGYEKGVEENDPVKRLNGKLNIASGAALLGPGTAPLSLLVAAGQIVTNRQLQSGAITAEQAEKRADVALAVSTGPFGAIASSVESELKDAGLLVKPQPGLDVAGFAPFGGSKKTLTKMGVGFAVGAALGGIVTPLIGGGAAHTAVLAAAAGSWAGGTLGAAAGFAADYLSQPDTVAHFAAARQQADPGLTKEDKKLLAKLAAPAVVGGAAGAVGGYLGGQTLGQVVGQALAGPAGGVTGAALGSYLGVLGGSYALAKGGAKLGAQWAGLKSAQKVPESAA